MPFEILHSSDYDIHAEVAHRKATNHTIFHCIGSMHTWECLLAKQLFRHPSSDTNI